MAGYIYGISKTGGSSDRSPMIDIMTFKRRASDRFDSTIVNAKKAGCKLGSIELHECPAFEQCGQVRQVIKTCSGIDKAGNPVKFFLERIHVGGQLEQRRSESSDG